MEIAEQLNRQRVKYIVSSYELEGTEPDAFHEHLNSLLSQYSSFLIELALAETLIANWLTVPMVRGCGFLRQAHALLKTWEAQVGIHTITPEQFQQITGLDPTPIFGHTRVPQASTHSRGRGL